MTYPMLFKILCTKCYLNFLKIFCNNHIELVHMALNLIFLNKKIDMQTSFHILLYHRTLSLYLKLLSDGSTIFPQRLKHLRTTTTKLSSYFFPLKWPNHSRLGWAIFIQIFTCNHTCIQPKLIDFDFSSRTFYMHIKKTF